MRKIFTLSLLLLFGIASLRAAGGPDAYGYTWKASTDAGGPTYAWKDISASGTLVSGLADDNSAPIMVNIGFPFHFYWSDFTKVKIGSNGWVAFDNVSNIASCFPTIPTPGGAGDNYIAAFMCDLNFTGGGNPGQVYTWTNFVDSFVVMYKNVPHWSVIAPGYTGSNSFEIILNKADSSITVMYQNLTPFTANAGCNDMTMGIENSTGGIGLQSFADIMPPATNYAIKYYYPNPVLIAVKDATPLWNMNTVNGGIFIPQGTFQLSSDVKNVGNSAITSSITVNAALKNLALTTVFSTSATLPSLNSNQDSLINFATLPNISTSGQYYYEVTTVNSQDINATNNTTTTEISIVDLCLPSMTLTYATGGTNTGSLNWNGGANDDGVAVYYIPPAYPFTIDQLQFYISSNSTDGYIAQIFDDDGVLGAAGTLLFTTTVTSGSITSATWNTVAVSPGVIVPDGGFYVAWFQTGTTCFIGTETNGPMSRRGFEILDGAWSEYRENNNQEFMIRAIGSGYSGAPTPTFTYGIAGTTVNFTNGTMGATSYSWDYGDGTTPGTTYSPSHTYSTPGYYNVCLTASTACTSATTCDTVYICGNPLSTFGYTNTGLNFSFTDSSQGAPTSWLWDFGDGGASNQPNPSHTYASPGTYTVCLITSNPCGNDTGCIQISTCPPLTAGFISSASGGTANFTNSSSAVGAWSWTFGDGGTSTTQHPSHTYTTCGTFNVCLEVTDSCGQVNTFCDVVTIDLPPTAAFTGSPNNLTVVFSNTSSGSGGTMTYAWDFGDGGTSTQQNPTYTYATDGSFTVCLIVTDSCGSDTICDSFTLTGIDAMFQGGSLNIYPNPTSGLFRINGMLMRSEEMVFELSDLAGKSILRNELGERSGMFSLDVDLDSHPSGVYFGTLRAGDFSHTFKVVKE